MPRTSSPPPSLAWAALRADLLRAAALAVLTALAWCAVYDRWTAESWQTPITYIADPIKSDVIGLLAGVRATRDGHYLPFQSANIPELGAPFVANWDDYPTTEKPIFWLMGLLAQGIGIFAAANVAVLLGQVLAALGFYAACRILKGDWAWAWAGAFVYGFARFAFSHGLHHLTIAYEWQVPLGLVVCGWIFRGETLDRPRLVFALAVAFVTGMQNVYYTFMFAQLVLLAGAVEMWRGGAWRRAWPAAAIIACAAAAFLLMNVPTFAYHFAHGPNSGAVVRDYHWLEVYGLKLVDLVVPPPDHSLPLFAAWGAGHAREVLLSFGELPPSGYLGLAGLAALGWLTVDAVRRAMQRRSLPLEAFIVLWVILFATVGGLNGLLGTLGFVMFRATTRYSIVILAVVLMYAVRRLTELDLRPRPFIYGAAVLIVLLAWWDQAPPATSDYDLQLVAAEVKSDRDFTDAMEQRLPAGAMVFQIPVMDYPESPAPGVPPYDHLRPYLYTHDLRFSFGADKGRPQGEWQQTVLQNVSSLAEVVARLEKAGFAAIYLNRKGYNDQGVALVRDLGALGYNERIESERGDLVCILLRPAGK